MTWSIVSVPVLSVQSTSIAPRFWMALSRLTMTFFLPIATAPLERQTVTIIGSISGVRPTATATAKKNASRPVALGQAVDDEDQRHHHQHEAQHQPGEPGDAAVEGRLRRLLRERLGHAAEVGVLAGGDDDGRRRAALDAGAQERDAGQLERRGRRAVALLDLELLDREALAGERALDHEQILGLDDPHVAGDHVAGGELDHVARHELRTAISRGLPSRRTVAVTEIMALSLAAALSALAS